MKKNFDAQKELENKIIGSLLNLNSFDEQLHYLSLIGSSKFFTVKAYREIFETLMFISLKERIFVDSIRLYDSLKKYAAEISETSMRVISAALLEDDIKFLKQKDYHRRLISNLTTKFQILKEAGTLPEIEDAKNSIILTSSTHSFDSESSLLDFEEMELLLRKNLSKEKNSKIDGYSFGITDLDLITNGIVIPKLYTIGALKKAGKTRFIIHTIRELYKQNIPVAFLSLEVPEYELYKLLKSSFLEIEDTQLRSSNLSYMKKEEILRMDNLSFDPQKLMIECKTGLNLGEVIHRLRKYSRMGAKVIFIDFFQRIIHDIKNKVNELEEIAQRLADTTREFNISLFMLSQLSNLAEKEVPSISHLKGTGGLAEASDTIMIFDNIYRRTGDERYKSRLDIDVTQRYGESCKISLFADLGTCTFRNYYKQAQEIF